MLPNEISSIKLKCTLCGRDKFTQKSPHHCVGGFRKRNIIWELITKKDMNTLKFKEGDWCFCQFKLQQIHRTDDTNITSVSDGDFSLSGSDLSGQCFPLTMEIKRISDNVYYWSNEFHKLKNLNVNHPDLHLELIRRWSEICENIDDKSKVVDLSSKLTDFAKNVIHRINSYENNEVEGVRLFRR